MLEASLIICFDTPVISTAMALLLFVICMEKTLLFKHHQNYTGQCGIYLPQEGGTTWVYSPQHPEGRVNPLFRPENPRKNFG